MPYSLDNALFQWREGERRLVDTPEPARADLERSVDTVVEELRKRLGSSFVLDELADLYGEGTDWATELAVRQGAGTDAATVVDAAFARYAREASNFAGGRARERHEKP
jgi:gamma-glutamyl:cysteine ligase YbdK (ATP-grasp superfamily)